MLGGADAETVGHHVEHFDRLAGSGTFGSLGLGGFRGVCIGRCGGALHGALGLHARVAAGREPSLDLFGRGAGRQFYREGHHEPRVVQFCTTLLQLGIDRLRRIVPHRQRGLAVVKIGPARKQELQVVVQLGHGAHGGTRAAHRVGLVDGDGGRHAFHPVHRRLVHAVQELARVGAEGLHITALAFGEQRVEHQAGFARPARPGDHGQFAGANVQVNVLQVVLARAADADQPVAGGRCGGVG